MKLFLNEMSYKRKIAMDRISGISTVLLRHIFILMLFPKAREKEHWLSEIDTFLVDIFITYNNIKGQETLSKKDYTQLLINEPLISSDQYGYIRKWIANTIRKENKIIPAFYHTSLTMGELDIIFESIKTLLIKVIERGMSDESISIDEFKQLMAKYVWSMKIYNKK